MSTKRHNKHGRVGVKTPISQHERLAARRRGWNRGYAVAQGIEVGFLNRLMGMTRAKDMKDAITLRLQMFS